MVAIFEASQWAMAAAPLGVGCVVSAEVYWSAVPELRIAWLPVTNGGERILKNRFELISPAATQAFEMMVPVTYTSGSAGERGQNGLTTAKCALG